MSTVYDVLARSVKKAVANVTGKPLNTAKPVTVSKQITVPKAAGTAAQKFKTISQKSPIYTQKTDMPKQNILPSAKQTGTKKGSSVLVSSLPMPELSDFVKKSTEQLNPHYLPLSDFRISSLYGVDRVTHRHSGIDLAVPIGTQVAAAKTGTVSFAGWGNGYGYRVVIDHKDGTQTTYNHLSDIGVKVGDEVRAGNTIALSGNSGNSDGPHLHFELKVDGRYVDPEQYFDFGNGLKPASSGNYVSQMASVSGKSSSGSSAKGSSSGGRSAKSKKKVSPVDYADISKVRYGDIPSSRYFRLTDGDRENISLPPKRQENHFSSDRNPLLDLVPSYRLSRKRTDRTRRS